MIENKNKNWEEENKRRWMFSAGKELGESPGFEQHLLTNGDRNCFLHYHAEGHTPTEAVERFIQYRETGKR